VRASAAEIRRAFAAPGETRLFLLHGPDDAGSRALVEALAAAMGAAAERIDLTGAELKADPARLTDEAAAISMFGDRRWIRVEQAGDESVAAVEALLDAPAAGNPVVIVASMLRATSALLKQVLAAPNALAFASYAPQGRDAEQIVAETARALGLDARGDVAGRVAEACGGNRALIARELEKYALYLGAEPGGATPLDHDAIDAIGADSGGGEGALTRLIDSAADGDAAVLVGELIRLRGEGVEGIGLTRPMLRRMAQLGRLRAEVEGGKSPSAVMASAGKSVFWKEKGSIQRQITRWRSDLLAKAIGRLIDAERAVIDGVGPIAADAELLAICRQAARLR
jgi:DNA polymerase-3 subunit delta